MSSVLNAIRGTLEVMKQDVTVPMEGVYYGACQEEKLDRWNYFVFNRKKTGKASNKRDIQTYYNIHIIHEDYIPEGYVERVIKELESMEEVKVRTTDDDIEYNYVFKGNSNMVVEIATITVFRPEKGC